MSLPVGVSTFELLFGKTFDFEGTPLRTDLTITPSHELVWEATGDRLVPIKVSKDADEGEYGSVLLPHTDQAGFVDLAGNAITDWWYTVQSTDRKGRSVSSTPKTRKLQATSDQTSVDLDLIPINGSVGPVGSTPLPAVTSVNGQTGAVTVEGVTDAALTAIAADEDSDFATQQRATYVSVPRVATLPTAAASVPKVYDGARNTYNLRASQLLKARAAIGKAVGGTGLASIACLGTSIAAGQGAAAATTSYPVRLRQLFEAIGVPIAGTGNVLCHHGDTTADARWAFTGGWVKFNPGPTSRTVLYSSTSNGSTATFTSDLAGTVVEVRYSNSSVPFTVAIDGGSAVTVTPSGGTSIGTYTVTGLADTTHTVVVTRTTGALYLVGANVRKTTGLQIHNVGLGGARVSDLNLSQPYDARGLVRDVLVPDLCLVNVMTNEAYTEVSAATFKTNLSAMLTSLQNAGIPVVLIGEIPAGGTTTPNANAMNLTAYRTALYELAITFDYPIIDLFERWGSYSTANTAGMMFDAFHPNAAGYGDYARAVLAAIS